MRLDIHLTLTTNHKFPKEDGPVLRHRHKMVNFDLLEVVAAL